MKNAVKKAGQWFAKMSFLLLLLVTAINTVSAAAIVPTEPEEGCPTPSSVTRTARTSSSISFSWGSSGTSYQVYYVRLSDSYTSAVMTTGSNSITIPGLAPGAYKFYIATVCEDDTSDYIVIEDLLMD